MRQSTITGVKTATRAPRRRWRMSGGARRSTLIVMLLGVSAPAWAGTSVIANGVAEIWVGAGNSTNSIDTVVYTVPGANVGDGTAIAGAENGTSATTLIDASARAPGSNSRTAIWTVDSSQPLVCSTPVSCGSTTIPLTKFRWTVSGGTEIASGTFSGTSNQSLTSFRNSRYVYVYKTYYFANDEVIPAGQYTGRVVYTLSMP